jgi:hypothetical protein
MFFNVDSEECGGTVPMQDMIEKWVKELESKRPLLTSLSKMKHGLYLTLSNSGLAASTSSLTRFHCYKTFFLPC